MSRYAKTNWVNYPVKTTPINAQNLNNIENGIEDNDNEIVLINTNIGSLENLETTEKTSLVGAINEVKGDIPTNVSDLVNDSNFIDATTNNLVNYYKKTETYTQAEVDTAISNLRNGLMVVVQELPQTGNTGVIYLVPKEDTSSGDNFDEYAYINNNWELLGSATIDLSNYVQKEAGKGLSSNDYTTAEKTKLADIETGAEVNTIETIKVNGTVVTPDANRAVDITVGGGGGSGAIDSISVNGTPQTIDANKNVDITVPTKTSDLTNDSNFVTNTDYAVTNGASGVVKVGTFNARVQAASGQLYAGDIPTIAEYNRSSNNVFISKGALETKLNYENYTKNVDVNAENTDITLNDTIDYKINTTLKGNTEQNGTPTPSSPVDVDVVTGNNEVKVVGKNLIEPLLPTSTKNGITCTNNGDGTFTLNGTATANADFRIDQLTPTGTQNLKKYSAGTYTISCPECKSNINLIVMQDVTWTSIINMQWNNQPVTKTIDTYEDCFVYVFVKENTTVDNVIIHPQLEKSSVATSWEPYQSQTYEVNLGNIELCKIGTYQDYIYKDNGKWYLHKEVGKAVIDGSESDWSNPSANRFNLDNYVNDYLKSENDITYFCDNYTAYNQTGYNGGFNDLVANVDYGFNFGSYTSFNIRFKDTRYTSASDFKAWLSTHNTIVYYVLTTPTNTEITYQPLIDQLDALEKAKGYNEQTHIMQENADLPFIIYAEQVANLSDLDSRISDIYDYISNLDASEVSY